MDSDPSGGSSARGPANHLAATLEENFRDVYSFVLPGLHGRLGYVWGGLKGVRRALHEIVMLAGDFYGCHQNLKNSLCLYGLPLINPKPYTLNPKP